MARTLSAGLAIAAALSVAAVATPSAAATYEGYSTNAVNQRTGPDVGYPVIQVIPGNAHVRIYGCLTGVTWCDTSYAGRRGWVSARYLQIYGTNHRPRPIIYFGFSSGLPLIAPWWDRPGNHRPPHHNDNDHRPQPPMGGSNPPSPPPSGNFPSNGNYRPPRSNNDHPQMCGGFGQPSCDQHPKWCGGPDQPRCPTDRP